MQTLNNTFEKHSICRMQQQITSRKILSKFGKYISLNKYTDWGYSLRKFSDILPLSYVNKNIFDDTVKYFSQNKEATIQALNHFNQEISNSIFSLVRPGASWAQEEHISCNEPRDILQIEQIWHPEYIRYSEHIYNHLIKIPLFILGCRKNKNYCSESLSNRIKTLTKNELSFLTLGFNSTIRNSLSHGSINYLFNEIEYVDRKKSDKYSSEELFTIFDTLFDTCNTLASAILIFVANNQTKLNFDDLPLSIKFLIVDGISSYRGNKLISAVESKTIQGVNQLNIHSESMTLSRTSHLFESLHYCWLFQLFSTVGYKRYSVSINCKKLVSPSIFIDGKELNNTIDKNLTPDESGKIIETNMLWFTSSSLNRKLFIWKNIIYLTYEIFKYNTYDEWKKLGLKVTKSKYNIKVVENISTKSIRRIQVYIILSDPDKINKVLLTEILQHAVGKLRHKLFYGQDFNGNTFFRRKAGYIWLNIYANNARLRTLKRIGWNNPNLVLKAEWTSNKYKNNRIVIKNADAKYANIFLQYNPNLFLN